MVQNRNRTPSVVLLADAATLAAMLPMPPWLVRS